MSRRNGKPIHANRLVPSTPDTVALGLAVEERFLTVFHLYLRTRGLQMSTPQSLDRDMYRWRAMRVRHKVGDLRNSEAELASTKAIAQWTVNLHMALRGQESVAIAWPG